MATKPDDRLPAIPDTPEAQRQQLRDMIDREVPDHLIGLVLRTTLILFQDWPYPHP